MPTRRVNLTVADSRMPSSGISATRGVTQANNGRRQPRAPAYMNKPQPGPVTPTPPASMEPFLPPTPQYESGQRSLTDTLSEQLASIGVSREQIPAMVQMFLARASTDQGNANRSLDESLTERGMFDSGSNAYLRGRDIYTPFGRNQQDFAAQVAQQYADLAAQEGSAYLGNTQGLMELLLQRAAQVAAQQPLSLPQF